MKMGLSPRNNINKEIQKMLAEFNEISQESLINMRG